MVSWECYAPLFDLFHYKRHFVLVYICVSFSCFTVCENAILALCISSYIYKEQWCLYYLAVEVMVSCECLGPLFDLFHYKRLFVLVYISLSFSCVSACEIAFSDTMHVFIYILETIMFLQFNNWGCGHLIVFRSFILSISI
jgi:hypothetical protein